MYKLSILSTLAFHKKIPLEKIYREGIADIAKADIENGKEFGYTLKLLAVAKSADGKYEARVHPAFVKNDNPLAAVKGSFNAVLIEGDNVGKVMLYGRGAGDMPTGSAVVSDIVYCALQSEHKYYLKKRETALKSKEFTQDSDCEYYIRITAADESGVLAKIAGVFAKNGMSINCMQQRPVEDGNASIIFFSHVTSEKNICKAVEKIKALTSVRSVNAVIRVV
jgi:homoserine dehydrogenase